VSVFCDLTQNVSGDYEEAVCTDENFDCENYFKLDWTVPEYGYYRKAQQYSD